MLFLGIYQKKETRILSTKSCAQAALSSFIHKSKLWRKARSTNKEWINRGWPLMDTPAGKTNEAQESPGGTKLGTRHGGRSRTQRGYARSPFT